MSTILNLSQEQKNAALTIDGPICILAGAGSGKTRVITHRIAYLIKDLKENPRSILGLTFTNKAAREMRERVEKLLPNIGHEINLGTFHGIAARFLRYYGSIVGIENDFLIYDEDDAVRLIKKILKEKYDLAKDELSAEVKKVMRFREEGAISREKTAASERAEIILELYQERLKQMGAVDFSGLLKKFHELLCNEEGLLAISNRINHLLVDEYQDTNAIQSEIVHILAKKVKTVAIVGDDDQSIYGWRGASAHFMQKFLTDFPGSHLFRLEDNYRSTKPILDAANALISHNKSRLGKTLRAINGDGPLLRLSKHYRDSHEASWVIEQSIRLFGNFGSSFQIAVLMRTNAQSRPLEEALHKARMPYRMVGGMKFYDRKEIKDIISALRAVIYNNSDMDLIRVLDNFSLGIGKKTIEALSIFSGSNGLRFYEVMQSLKLQEEALGNTRARNKIESVVNKIENMRKELVRILPDGEIEIMRADEALIYVIDCFGIAAKLEQKNDDEAASRLENIEQLVQAAVSFVEEAESLGQPSDAQAFLENVALVSKDESVQEGPGANFGTITLMTLHAAKGLEFDGVFLVGLEEGVLPHNRSLYGQDENKRNEALEEERRLMYVGLTRAKKRLFLSYCQERFLHGSTSISPPSRFLSEIPENVFDLSDRFLLKQSSTKAGSYAQGAASGFSWSTKAKPVPKKTSEEKLDYHIEYEDEYLNGPEAFKVGNRVFHASYRYGRIISVSGFGKMSRAQVKFDDDTTLRMIMLSHLKRV